VTHQADSEELSRLKSILGRKSITFGDFTLVSGEKSNVYVDGKLTTCFAEAMPLIGRAFLHKLKAKGWFPDAVGGLTVGAEPIAFAIARESIDTGHPINAFIVRKEPKPHGRQRLVEGLETTEGCNVVIIDDVCTKGGSTVLAIKNAKSVGMKVIGAVCLVDRQMGASDLLKREFGCELESIFKLSDFHAEHESNAATSPVGANV
jgi:orotate phosphoribosyltransferase